MKHEESRARKQQILEAFAAAGAQSQREIAVQFGVSAAYVSLIVKRAGLGHKDGARHKDVISRTAKQLAARMAQLQKRYLYNWLCSKQEFLEVNASFAQAQAKKLEKIYQQHRDRSQREQRTWNISYPQYAELMREKIVQYGRGGYVLRLLDPAGDYTADNVIVVSHSDSSRAARLTARQGEIYSLYLSGNGPTQISKALGIAVGTVATILGHAKRMASLQAH